MDFPTMDITEKAKDLGILDAFYRGYKDMGIHVLASNDELAAQAFLERSLRPEPTLEDCKVLLVQTGIHNLIMLTLDSSVGWCAPPMIGDKIVGKAPTALIGATVHLASGIWPWGTLSPEQLTFLKSCIATE